MAEQSKTIERPLSPHLQIYRWPLGMATSIMHRISGCALAVGTLMVVWALVSAASGPAAWAVFTSFCGTLWGQLALYGWSLALFYHLCNGVRHLVWDTGRLFVLKHAKISSRIVLLAAALMTVAFWYAASPWKGE